MIVVAILGLLAAIAYPSYQGYIEKGNRADMMSEMHNIASQIESRKLARGSYSNDLVSGLGGSFPSQGTALYTISFSPSPLTSKWTLTATPVVGTRMATDGNLTLNDQGLKCRAGNCSMDEQWK